MRIALIVLSFFFILSSTNIGQANDLERGIAAFNNQDYAKAKQFLGPLAHEANPDAMFYIGQMYDFGFGLRYDDYEADQWYQYAGRKGNVKANFYAAFLLRESKKEVSKHLYSESIKLGFKPTSPLEEGMQAYLESEYLVALNLWEKAARKNNKDAMYFLGELYNELSLKELYDEKKSLLWYGKAAKLGHGIAAFNLAIHYWGNNEEEKVVYWGVKAAENGFYRGYEIITDMYFFDKKYDRFIEWSKKGVLNGCPEFKEQLLPYSEYSKTNGCPNLAGPIEKHYLKNGDKESAIYWLETAVKKGHYVSAYGLAEIYQKSPKDADNRKLAYKWSLFYWPDSVGIDALHKLLAACSVIECSREFYFDVYKWTRISDRKKELRKTSIFPEIFDKNSKLYKKKYDLIESKLSIEEIAKVDKHVKQCVSKYYLSYCQ
ncbi:hypothetical protein [Terasakiella pusilla]|uniref:tetratricopeptide repeat protein n=1 Tax=Terasakiella pusilla TaxID=64973 RepID=UPI003AA94066